MPGFRDAAAFRQEGSWYECDVGTSRSPYETKHTQTDHKQGATSMTRGSQQARDMQVTEGKFTYIIDHCFAVRQQPRGREEGGS